MLLLLQMLRVYPHLVYKSQLISESDMTVHLYAEGQERQFFFLNEAAC